MKLKVFAVVVFDENGDFKSCYDGKDYVDDISQMKIFPPGMIAAARTEQGSHQRYQSTDEVRVLKMDLDIPDIQSDYYPSEKESLPPVPASK